MDEVHRDKNDLKDLAYKLPDGVHFSEKKSGLYLIRENPLSTIELNCVWKPVFDKLSKGGFIQFKELLSLVDTTIHKIEIFLNNFFTKLWALGSLIFLPHFHFCFMHGGSPFVQ